jgi:hypothetical protein
MKNLLIVFTFGLVILSSGCGNSTPSKGQQTSDCLDRNSPEECDRQVNRRPASY